MNNFEKYSKLHDEVMKRLEDGEITIEKAKEINDLAFEKYISEAKIIPFNPHRSKSKNRTVNEINADLTFELMDIRRLYDNKIKQTDDPDEKAKLEKEKQEKIDEKTAEATEEIEKIRD